MARRQSQGNNNSAAVNTTTNAAVAIKSFTPQHDNCAYDMTWVFVGKDSTNRTVTARIQVNGKVIAGVLTVEGSAAAVTYGNAALTGVVPSVAVVGGAFVGSVVGIAATVIAWTCWQSYQTTEF